MRYREQIHPELRRAAKNIPYNRAVILCANLFQEISFRLTAVPRGIVHRNIAVEGYRGRKFRTDIFAPSDGTEKLPCLIYVHGGAFSYKASAHHKKLACLYAKGANCRVYFPDYHLAPRYRYPAAYADITALYRYVLNNAEALGIDPERIGVAGDSAGACLAALLGSRYAREGLKQPRVQMLLYPATDAAMRTESMKRFSDTPLWNAKSNKRMWRYYCGAGDARAASPMHTPLPASIPDTYIETTEFDCLHDEGILYGKRLREAGAKVKFHETAGTFHGYDIVLHASVTVGNIRKRIRFLQKGFWGGPSAARSDG